MMVHLYAITGNRFGLANSHTNAPLLDYSAPDRLRAFGSRSAAYSWALANGFILSPAAWGHQLYRVCWTSNYGLATMRSGLIHTLETARELVETGQHSAPHWIEDASGVRVA